MGTRGTLGFVIDGEPKLAYNHFDSYPDGLGIDVLKWASEVTNWDTIRRLARDLKLVSDEVAPTEEQIKQLIQYHNEGVSTGYPTEWYSLLRHTQGQPRAILEAGYMEDASGFPMDSLFCEYGYVIDLDHEQLEVYAGFQRKPHQEGRFVADFQPRDTHRWVRGSDYPDHGNPDTCFHCSARVGTPEFEQACPEAYYPIRLVKAYPFDALPEPTAFVTEIENLTRIDDEEAA